MKFQVITGVPDMSDDRAALGNLAAAFEVWQADPFGVEVKRIDVMAALTLRVPVFQVGEVLIVDEDGRELVGAGRRASKWSVTYEEFDTVEVAVGRAKELQSW